jgi:Fe-S cluster biogenesis protein NfuA
MDDSDHRRQAARIEQLLEDLRSMAAGPVWQRIEELVQRLVQLYGAGLASWARHLQEAGVDEAVAPRVAGDELLGSLLLLHGLHPWPVERRVEAALERARPQLRAHVGEIVFLGLAGDVARVRLDGTGTTAEGVAERLIQRALGDAAPEIVRVEIDGAAPPEPRERPPALVQIGLPRPRPPEAPR